MTVPTNPASGEATTSPMASLLKAIGILKSVDEGALKDLEPIPTGNIESHSASHEMPTEAEVDTGPMQSMRGGTAEPEIARHSKVTTQYGMTREYQELNSRLFGTQKAVKALADTVNGLVGSINAAVKAQETADMAALDADYKRKAAEDEAAKSLAAREASLSAAVRKARIAIRKAEDEDEEDKEEAMEKAEAALKNLATLVSKAEDEAETDEEEKAAEKARTELRGFKKALAKSKAPAVTATPAAPAPAAKSGSVVEDEIAALAASKGMTPAAFIATLTGNGPTGSVGAVPAFAKAVQAATGDAIAERFEAAASAGELDMPAIAKAESIMSRLAAARSGRYDMDSVINEIALADMSVRNIFAPAMAV